jgi:hypothetical protein
MNHPTQFGWWHTTTSQDTEPALQTLASRYALPPITVEVCLVTNQDIYSWLEEKIDMWVEGM